MVPSPKTSPATARRRITSRDFFVTSGTSIAIQACTLFQGILLARTLGPKGRGEFAAATLWPMFFGGICSFGTTVAIARRSARMDCTASLAWAAVRLSLLTAAAGTVICWPLLPALIPAGDPEVLRAARYFIPFILCNHITMNLMAVDQGAGRFSHYNWTRLIVNPVFLLGIVLLWLASVKQSLWYVVALLAGNAAVALVRFALVFRLRGSARQHVYLSGLLRESIPFGLAELLTPLYQQADKALTLFLLGTEQLGLYAVAMTASMAIGSLSSAAAPVVFGISAQEDPSVSVGRISRAFRMTAWIWLLTGLMLAAAIPWLLPFIYTRAFEGAVEPAIFLIPAGAFACQSSILEESLRARGFAFVGITGRAFGLIAMVAIGVFLAPRWRILGVVLAYNAAQLVVLCVMMWLFRRHFPRLTGTHLSPRVSDLIEMSNRCRQMLRPAAT